MSKTAMFILIVIYLAFVCLGLPNGLLGSAWPVMQGDLGVPLESAGIISMVIFSGMIISGVFSGKLINRLGHVKITIVSLSFSSAALLGFWLLPSIYWLCVAAFMLGLGCGAMDSTLNHYVSVHYKTSHMNWLHGIWGLGASIGPMIMAQHLYASNAWRGGYLICAVIVLCVLVVVIASQPVWKRVKTVEPTGESKDAPVKSLELLKLPGVLSTFLFFFSYCAMEVSINLWGSSYLVEYKGLSSQMAAMWLSVFFIGITAGRFIAGFISMKASNKLLIRASIIIGTAGAVLMVLPLPGIYTAIGMLLMGLGAAPGVPCMLQETPLRYGEKNAQYIIGFQMAAVFVGATVTPPLVGAVASFAGMTILPWVALAFFLLMLLGSEYFNQKTSQAARIGATL